MIETLPKGVTIGAMQAPLSWIFSHTSRFVGIVRITIQDGNGVILIEKGVPKVFYFEHGSRTLKGNAAREYLNAQPLLDFSLNKLTAEEFSLALSRADPEAASAAAADADRIAAAAGNHPDTAPAMPEQPAARPEPAVPADGGQRVVIVRHGKGAEAQPASPVPAPAPAQERGGGSTSPPLERPSSTPPTWAPVGRKVALPEKESEPFDIFEDTTSDSALTEERLRPAMPARKAPPPVAQPPPPRQPPAPAVPEKTLQPDTTEADEADETGDLITDEDFRIIAQVLLGRIKTIPGVIAVMVFNKDMHLLSIGDVNLDRLVSSAEDMLMTVSQLDSMVEWGSFVSMMLQVPSGNVIVAPFFDEYLCILTSPEINLGRIRRILREIKSQQKR